MLRIFVYVLVTLLVCAGVGVVYVEYGTSAYELLVLPILALARKAAIRTLTVVAESFARWGWNRTIIFLLLVLLPTLWRRPLTRKLAHLREFLKAHWLSWKSQWSDRPKVIRRVAESVLFLILCFGIVYAEEAAAVVALAFVRIPLLSPAMKWMRTVAVRFLARLSVAIGLGLLFKKMAGADFVSMLEVLRQDWIRYYGSWRQTFARRVFKKKKLLKQEVIELSRRIRENRNPPAR